MFIAPGRLRLVLFVRILQIVHERKAELRLALAWRRVLRVAPIRFRLASVISTSRTLPSILSSWESIRWSIFSTRSRNLL